MDHTTMPNGTFHLSNEALDQIAALKTSDATEAFKLGMLNRSNIKPEHLPELDARLTALRHRIERGGR